MTKIIKKLTTTAVMLLYYSYGEGGEKESRSSPQVLHPVFFKMETVLPNDLINSPLLNLKYFTEETL